MGADAIGELRKMSEAVGKEAAEKLRGLNWLLSRRWMFTLQICSFLIWRWHKGKSAFLVEQSLNTSNPTFGSWKKC
jgi:hypothetical protein